MESNVIVIRIGDEFFESVRELVEFAARKLCKELEFWPERACGRNRTVTLENCSPRRIVYRVEYHAGRCNRRNSGGIIDGADRLNSDNDRSGFKNA